MKLIKFFLLVVIGLCAGTLLQAQQVKTEVAKPIESALPVAGVNDTKPNPDLTANKKPQQQAALKQSTEQPVSTDQKEELVKPQVISAKIIAPLQSTTLSADKREDAPRPVPMIPAENKTITTTPPVKTEIIKPAAVQQKPAG